MSICSDSSASTYSPYPTRLFSVVVRCVGSGFHILPFSASYTLMSKNRSWYMIAVCTWLKVGSNSAIDRSTTIILYLLSFRGAAIKETCASTMSLMRNIWGFTVSTLMMTVSIVICALVCAFRTFCRPLNRSHIPDNSTPGFLHHARTHHFSGIQGCHEDLSEVKWGWIPCQARRILM